MAPDFDFESSDILGGALPVGRGRVSQNSGFSFFFKICALGASTLLLLLAFRHGRTFFLRWKERHYKLSMRRRYGIPDNDQRPFNVAYASARLAQEDKRKIQDRLWNVSTLDQLNSVANEPTGSANQPTLTPVTLQVSGHDRNAKPITKRSPFHAVPATQPLRIPVPSSHADVSGSRLQPVSGHTNARDEGSGDQREARPEGDHAVHDSGIDVDSAPVPRRSKRMADASDDSDLRSSQENRHDKRRRKVSSRHLKKRTQKGDDVEMDGIPEVRMSHSGKKRDRTEMDSSFGPDDDLLYNDADTDFTLHRHRRRRQRKSSNVFRGQKRGRDADLLGVDTDSGDLRGRRKALRHRPDTSDTDPSVDDGQISRDPLCGGRPIGEEWEAHGVQFRVGSDGKRLRRVLVKEDRPKFNMPVDSEHPDRSASVTAIVERWYTEEQYTAAKGAQELAWQDSDKPFSEPETQGDRMGKPSNAGKQLLWASTSNTGSPVRKIRLSSHSSIASPRLALLPVAPPPQYTRRVSSLYTSPAAKPTEMSPKLRPSNSYSKWEKQEIEAEAIARLRRKAEEKEKAKAEAEAREAEAKKVATAPALPTVLPVKCDEKPPVAPPTATPAFSLPSFSKGSSQTTEPSNPPPLFKMPAPSSNSNSQPSEAKDKSEGKMAAAIPGTLFPFPSAPIPATQTPASTPAISGPVSSNPNSNPTISNFTSASTPAASGPVSSNPTVPNFFTQNSQSTTMPSSVPGAKGSANPSLFSFGQTKAPSTNPISNVTSAPQGNSSNAAPQSFFSFSQASNPPTSTSNSANPTASALPAGGTADAMKPKFNFGMTSKPTSVTPSNPPAAPAPTGSDSLSKPIFSFGPAKTSSSVAPPTANLFSNTVASSTPATQLNQPSTFGTTEGRSAGVSVSSSSEGANSTNQAKPTVAANGQSTVLFPVASGGTQGQGGTTKPSPFGTANVSTTKGFFSFGGGADTSSGTKLEPGKTASAFTFNASPANSTPAAVPPTPGSVFSDTAAKSSQSESANPIPQPSFGAPKNAAAPSTSGFGFGQTSAPFSFGSFGTQKS